jgi:hypothetical protein
MNLNDAEIEANDEGLELAIRTESAIEICCRLLADFGVCEEFLGLNGEVDVFRLRLKSSMELLEALVFDVEP